MADANAVQSTWAPLRYRPYWGLVFAGALFLVFVLLYAQVVPPLEGPDAGAHFRYAIYLRDHGLPPLDAERAEISHQLVQQPPLYYGLVAAASLFSPGDETLGLEELNPYLEKGLSRRATVTPLEPPSLTVAWPLYAAVIIATVGGLLAVAGTWLLVHAMMPHTPLLATAAAVVVGLNPQFLFSAATVTNDTWTAATTVLAMWLAVCALKQPQRPWLWLAAGMVAGLA
ncbi:MAG: hypothetical protein H3C34_12040, partial [Caldilineaceae bacterium]|nr:hypothetical protein [Caldilineaceae bacterium]